MDPTVDTSATWPDAIFAHFRRARIRQVGYVPDAGHSRLIQRCIEDRRHRGRGSDDGRGGRRPRRGRRIGGDRAALLMQSSGVGNCINMFSLIENCGFPCLVLVTMRGEFAEFNPWQIPMGSITDEVLRLSGFLTYRIDHPDDVDEVVGAAIDMAFDGSVPIAVLLSQRLIGRKVWSK